MTRHTSLPAVTPLPAKPGRERDGSNQHLNIRPGTRDVLGESTSGVRSDIPFDLMFGMVGLGLLAWIGAGIYFVDNNHSGTSLVIQAQQSERGER